MTLKSMIPDPSSRRPAGPLLETPFDLAHRLDTAIWVFDIDTARIVYANAAACHLWQADTEQLLCARNLGRDMSSTVRNRLKQYQADFLGSDESFSELWTLYPNGIPWSVMVTFRGFMLPDGRMAMQCEVINDSENKPENLRSAEALLHTDVMIMLFDKEGPSLYLNPAARNAFYGKIENFSQILVEAEDYRDLRSQVDIVGEHRSVIKLRTSMGQGWFDVSAKKCSDAATGQPAILVTAIDVSELKEARDTARNMADRDQLTGTFNRAYLQNYLAESNRRISDRWAIVFFDVDRFKLINDRFGHEAGDTVLKVIAQRSGNAFRETDLVARLGGDEFVILVDGIDGQDDLYARISQLRTAIASPIIHDKTRIDVSISVGVSVFGPATSEFNEVLREADIALYASKAGGRDCVTYYTEDMGIAASARDRLEIELKDGIANSEFELHYQPRFDLEKNKVVGLEGLVRWKHPTRGLVQPNDFIPVCEETGLIEDLGRLVLSQGCMQAITWHNAGLDIDVSLNISPRQFADPSLIQTLSDLSRLPDFPVGRIELEVTENVLIGDPDAIAEKLRVITLMGFNVAIDDFGTGYSNLAYISRFPLTCMKIDRSFIDQLPAAGPIVQLIITLGHQIGATVVSEGVETQDHLDWLKTHNCCQVQGHFIAPAMPVPQIEAFLAASN